MILKGLDAAKNEQWAEAVSSLEAALKLDPKSEDAYEALAVIFGKMGRLDEAIESIKKLIAVNPDHIMAHANLSRFYQQKGMIFEAEAEQAEARRLSWKFELQSSGGDPDALLGDEQADAARIQEKIERYKKVIELDPKDVLGYFTLGSALHEAKRFHEASDILSQAILADPQHSPSYVILGLCYEAMGNAFKAKITYETGIPVAQGRGDIIPLRKMESRLRHVSKSR